MLPDIGTLFHAVPSGQRRLGDVPPQPVSGSRNQPDLRHENSPFSFSDRLWALDSASWPRQRVYPFRPLGRRSGRIPALPYPPPR
jgi:hypothetical protein